MATTPAPGDPALEIGELHPASRIIGLYSNPGQVEPGPFSENDLREQWNAQADELNQWESLDSSEQLAWAQARAIAADQLLPPVTKPTPADLAALHDPDFSDGLTPGQHLDLVRCGGDSRVPQKERSDFQEGYRAGLADGKRLHDGADLRVAATPAPEEPEAERVLRLAAIIREADGTLQGVALALAALADPAFSGCHDGPAALPAQEQREVEELLEFLDSLAALPVFDRDCAARIRRVAEVLKGIPHD